MSVPVAAFGPGIAIVRRIDLANGVAVNVGYANELSIDFSGTIKELFGQNQYPLLAARGTIKATGKLKAATISGLAWNNVFFGQTFTASGLNWAIGEVGVVPTTPFTVTVAQAATFDADLGVVANATGLPYQRVAGGAEVAGKSYSVTETGGNKGKYVFAAGDVGLTFNITYAYTIATGQILNITNALIGTTPIFQLDYYTVVSQPLPKTFIIRCFGCVGSKITLAAKLEDFVMPEIDFSLFADNTGRVVNIAYPEVS